ncbi:MAG: NAD(P)H-binding protein [Alphaproteobacteria bacterium]|nr:NAD(P)H-binding protein [Alphaproteobacteria bacterium]
MNIIVFGAAGAVGRRAVDEALSRGHQVTAVIRQPEQAKLFQASVRVEFADVLGSNGLEELLVGQGLVISALRPPAGWEQLLVPMTEKILRAAAACCVRVMVVGGAASLKLKNKDTTVLTEPGFLPEHLLPIATACQAQYELCLKDNKADWTYQTPPAMLEPGVRTGQYRLGGDVMLADTGGQSRISMEDFAVALLDEAEQIRHRRKRYSVAY